MTLGIDEVGRGSLAGPLVVGAVCLKKPLAGLKDSKLLSKKRRIELDQLIRTEVTLVRLGWVWPEEIDRLGLTQAMKEAINRALLGLNLARYNIVLDGNYNFLSELSNCRCLIGADNLIPEVSAASIVAKVARDRFMMEQAALYPEYGFENNVGYGTKEHRLAIKANGLSIIHRRSFKLREELLNSL